MKRFWDKVKKSDGCWEWTGAKGSHGYGNSYYNGKAQLAHRVSWQLAHGDIPSSSEYHGTCVCHTCDNRACVNPDHLFLGTHKDNMADRDAKGKSPIGELNGGGGKLTEQDIPRIRDMLRCGAKQKDIADWFGVSPSMVYRIKRGQAWRHAY
jgi:hypothetical protein